MRDIIFYLGTEIVVVRINQKTVTFMAHSTYSNFVPIERLHLSQAGVEKEFPHLKGSPAWREEAIVLFKQHLNNLDGEDAVEKYVISDLSHHGYIAKSRMRQGHRPEAIHA